MMLRYTYIINIENSIYFIRKTEYFKEFALFLKLDPW